MIPNLKSMLITFGAILRDAVRSVVVMFKAKDHILEVMVEVIATYCEVEHVFYQQGMHEVYSHIGQHTVCDALPR